MQLLLHYGVGPQVHSGGWTELWINTAQVGLCNEYSQEQKTTHTQNILALAHRDPREWSLPGFRKSFNIHTYGTLRKTVHFAHELIHEPSGFVKLKLTTRPRNQFSHLTQRLNNDPKRSTWAVLQHKDKMCLRQVPSSEMVQELVQLC